MLAQLIPLHRKKSCLVWLVCRKEKKNSCEFNNPNSQRPLSLSLSLSLSLREGLVA
jgi:hypothetical protein